MEIHPDSLGTLQVAVGLPKGDEKFLKLVNDVVAEMKPQLDAAKLEHSQDYLAQVMKRREERIRLEEELQAPRDITIRVSRAAGCSWRGFLRQDDPLSHPCDSQKKHRRGHPSFLLFSKWRTAGHHPAAEQSGRHDSL